MSAARNRIAHEDHRYGQPKQKSNLTNGKQSVRIHAHCEYKTKCAT